MGRYIILIIEHIFESCAFRITGPANGQNIQLEIDMGLRMIVPLHCIQDTLS